MKNKVNRIFPVILFSIILILNLSLINAQSSNIEAKIIYDQSSHELVVSGINTDNSTSLINVASSDRCNDIRCVRKIKTFTLTKENSTESLVLTMSYLKLYNQLNADIISLKYNNDPVMTFKKNKNKFVVKDAMVNRGFNQYINLNDFSAIANYNKKYDYTKIYEKKASERTIQKQLDGLRLLVMSTDNGELKYSVV